MPAQVFLTEPRRFPPPLKVDETECVFHRQRPQQASTHVRLLSGGARPSCNAFRACRDKADRADTAHCWYRRRDTWATGIAVASIAMRFAGCMRVADIRFGGMCPVKVFLRRATSRRQQRAQKSAGPAQLLYRARAYRLGSLSRCRYERRGILFSELPMGTCRSSRVLVRVSGSHIAVGG